MNNIIIKFKERKIRLQQLLEFACQKNITAQTERDELQGAIDELNYCIGFIEQLLLQGYIPEENN